MTADELSTCMSAAEDMVTTSGHTLVPKGTNITDPVRLQCCAHTQSLQEPMLVEVITEED